MKTKILVLVLLLVQITLKAQTSSESLSETHKKHLAYLCSEELGGRKTAEKGQKLAAEYIAHFFRESGLKNFEQLPDSTPYFQDFYLYFWDKGSCKVIIQGDSVGRGLLIYPVVNRIMKDTSRFELKLAGVYKSHHLKEIDTKQFTPILVFDKKIKSDKLAEILNKLSKEYNFERVCISFTQNVSNKQRIFSETVFGNRPKSEKGFEKETKKYTYLKEVGEDLNENLKVYYMPYYVLGIAMKINYKKFDHYFKRDYVFSDALDLKLKAHKVDVNAYRTKDSIKTENVLAYIPGKTDKNIIITAHYDHIGTNYNGICVGADDNASGTSVIMELAKSLAAKEQPNCNLIFIAFSAEEMGLYGSDFYANNPLMPLDKTVGVLNLDMVGRPDLHEGDFVHATFAGRKERALKRPIMKVAKNQTAFELDLHPGLKERTLYHFGSDHFSFTRKKVSNVVFFTDDHNDYHTPTDTPDKIDYDNMAAITNFVEKCILGIDKKN